MHTRAERTPHRPQAWAECWGPRRGVLSQLLREAGKKLVHHTKGTNVRNDTNTCTSGSVIFLKTHHFIITNGGTVLFQVAKTTGQLISKKASIYCMKQHIRCLHHQSLSTFDNFLSSRGALISKYILID